MTKSALLESRFPEIIAELAIKMDEVARAGANLVAADAKEKVHVGPGDGPHLKDRIHTERVSGGTYAVVAGDTDTFWGHLLENGTTHSAPYPFLVPSLEEDKPEVIALAEAAVRSVE